MWPLLEMGQSPRNIRKDVAVSPASDDRGAGLAHLPRDLSPGVVFLDQLARELSPLMALHVARSERLHEGRLKITGVGKTFPRGARLAQFREIALRGDDARKAMSRCFHHRYGEAFRIGWQEKKIRGPEDRCFRRAGDGRQYPDAVVKIRPLDHRLDLGLISTFVRTDHDQFPIRKL